MMRFVIAAALAALPVAALAAPPTVQTSNGPKSAVPTYLVDGSGNPIVGLGGSGTSTPTAATLTAVSSTTITTANTYQTVLAAGKSAIAGGCIFANSANSATIYVDPTGATGVTLSNAAIPVAAGASVCWPAITSAVSVYGPAGAAFTGSGG